MTILMTYAGMKLIWNFTSALNWIGDHYWPEKPRATSEIVWRTSRIHSRFYSRNTRTTSDSAYDKRQPKTACISIQLVEADEYKSWGSLISYSKWNFLHNSVTSKHSFQKISKGYQGTFSRRKAAGECNWPLTSNQCQGQESVDIRLHGVVLN
jgi:hypothetical protein